MSPGQSIDLLSRVPLFSELSREELERISRVSVARSFPAGVRVFHEGVVIAQAGVPQPE